MKPEERLRSLVTDAGIARAREALSSAQMLERLIALKLSRLDKTREEEKRLGALGNGEIASKLRQMEDALLSDYRALLRRREEVERLIGRVPDERHRAVLEMRYLEGLPFFRIAVALHYDERQIYRYHRSGLLHAAVQMSQRETGKTPAETGVPGENAASEKSD